MKVTLKKYTLLSGILLGY
ncbi:hypothetical protein CGLO_15112 [Colletotrichum gloeosporioides Cg-14]|uniref:Uncharacterized protein n=1 Tax=Colletotrichum gloeosporioides (strain Cg-14) TaxID=1237896 RepID=T0JZJ3_COLGC|nr:hypothetical protein CGLO_15112 [Colletotrichum gloeosporioides Cg-14]